MTHHINSLFLRFTVTIGMLTFGILSILDWNDAKQHYLLRQLSPALCATMAVKLSDCLPKKHQSLGIFSPYVGMIFYCMPFLSELFSFYVYLQLMANEYRGHWSNKSYPRIPLLS